METFKPGDGEALLASPQPVAVQEATEPESEYDRMKRQKDTILLGERLKHCTCDECGASKADGWALYCVSCSEILRTTDEQAKISVEQIEKAELRLLLNRRRTQSLEGDPNFYDGVRWAESICTSTAQAAPTEPPAQAEITDAEILDVIDAHGQLWTAGYNELTIFARAIIRASKGE